MNRTEQIKVLVTPQTKRALTILAERNSMALASFVAVEMAKLTGEISVCESCEKCSNECAKHGSHYTCLSCKEEQRQYQEDKEEGNEYAYFNGKPRGE